MGYREDSLDGERKHIPDAIHAHRDKTWLITLLSSLIPELFQAVAEPHRHLAHTQRKKREASMPQA